MFESATFIGSKKPTPLVRRRVRYCRYDGVTFPILADGRAETRAANRRAARDLRDPLRSASEELRALQGALEQCIQQSLSSAGRKGAEIEIPTRLSSISLISVSRLVYLIATRHSNRDEESLDLLRLFEEVNDSEGEERLALARDYLRIGTAASARSGELLWAGRWYELGCPDLRIEARLGAGLIFNDLREEVLADLTAPWPTFRLIVESGLLPSPDADEDEWISEVAVHHAANDASGAWIWQARDTAGRVAHHEAQALGALTRLAEPKGAPAELRSRLVRTGQLIGRLIIGVCALAAQPGALQPRRSGRSGARLQLSHGRTTDEYVLAGDPKNCVNQSEMTRPDGATAISWRDRSRPRDRICGRADVVHRRLAARVAGEALALLEPDYIESIGEDLGIVRKHRLHHAGMLVCAMIMAALEHGSDLEKRWNDIRLNYRRLGGPESDTTSIIRMGQRMLPVLEGMIHRRMSQIVAETHDLSRRDRLRALGDALVGGGCVFKLAHLMSGIDPGSGRQAELKIHAVLSSEQARRSAKTNTTLGGPSNVLRRNDWQSGILYIQEVGNKAHFVDAVQRGALVLERLNGVSLATIASNEPTESGGKLLEDSGASWPRNGCQSVLVQQDVTDQDIRITDTSGRGVEARLVRVPTDGVPDDYLTTLPRRIFSPRDLAQLHGFRSEIELLFKEWRTGQRFDGYCTLKNPDSLAVAVSASMLAVLLGPDFRARLEDMAAEGHPITVDDDRSSNALPTAAPQFAPADHFTLRLGALRASHAVRPTTENPPANERHSFLS
jgi:hypothetical protein